MTSIFKKLATAIRGHATEAGQAAVDANAITILEQEIRDANTALKQSDQSLTSIMAKRKLQENKVNELTEQIDKFETHAGAALEKGDEGLAIECAEKVGELENTRTTDQQMLDTFKTNETTLKANIKKAKHDAKLMQGQIDQIKATESVQKAQVAVSASYNGANSNMKTAADSLARIKDRQAQTAAELESADELAASENGGDLEAKLAAAGVTGNASSTDDILARIKAKKAQ